MNLLIIHVPHQTNLFVEFFKELKNPAVLLFVVIAVLIVALSAKGLGLFTNKLRVDHMQAKQAKYNRQNIQYCIQIINQIIGELSARINNEANPSTIIYLRDKYTTLKSELENNAPLSENPESLSMTYQQNYQDYDSRLVGLMRELTKYIN